MKKILLIEDNVRMRENTAEVLQMDNYYVVTAENGLKGLEMAKKVKPDLIICDIMMPDMDGYGVLENLSKDAATKTIPFIFLTAKTDRSDVRKGMNLGADDYLTKPFGEKELLEAIEARLKRKESYTNNLEQLKMLMMTAKNLQLNNFQKVDYRVRKFKEKDTIYYEGDTAGILFYINSGKVKTWKMGPDGEEFITGLYKAGDFLGYTAILEGECYLDSATALDDTVISLIPQDDFLALIYSSHDVALRFVKILANNVTDNEERLISLAIMPVKSRLAGALLQLQKKYTSEEKEPADIHISRYDLANMVGTSRETTVRTLTDFKRKGLIKTGKGRVKLLNTDKLEEIRKSL